MLVHQTTQTSCLRRPLISCIPKVIKFCNYSHKISNNNRAKSQAPDITSKSILVNKSEERIRPNSNGRNDNNRSGNKASELSKSLLVSTLEKLEKYIVDQAQHNKTLSNEYTTVQGISPSSLESPTSLTLIEPLKVNQLSDVEAILKSDSQKVDFSEVIELHNTHHILDISKALKMYIDNQLSPFQQIQLMNMLIAKHNFTNAAIILNNLKLPIDDTITILQRLMKKGFGSKWAELQFLRNFQKFCSSKALLKQVDSSIDTSLLDLLNTLEEKYILQAANFDTLQSLSEELEEDTYMYSNDTYVNMTKLFIKAEFVRVEVNDLPLRYSTLMKLFKNYGENLKDEPDFIGYFINSCIKLDILKQTGESDKQAFNSQCQQFEKYFLGSIKNGYLVSSNLSDHDCSIILGNFQLSLDKVVELWGAYELCDPFVVEMFAKRFLDDNDFNLGIHREEFLLKSINKLSLQRKQLIIKEQYKQALGSSNTADYDLLCSLLAKISLKYTYDIVLNEILIVLSERIQFNPNKFEDITIHEYHFDESATELSSSTDHSHIEETTVEDILKILKIVARTHPNADLPITFISKINKLLRSPYIVSNLKTEHLESVLEFMSFFEGKSNIQPQLWTPTLLLWYDKLNPEHSGSKGVKHHEVMKKIAKYYAKSMISIRPVDVSVTQVSKYYSELELSSTDKYLLRLISQQMIKLPESAYTFCMDTWVKELCKKENYSNGDSKNKNINFNNKFNKMLNRSCIILDIFTRHQSSSLKRLGRLNWHTFLMHLNQLDSFSLKMCKRFRKKGDNFIDTPSTVITDLKYMNEQGVAVIRDYEFNQLIDSLLDDEQFVRFEESASENPINDDTFERFDLYAYETQSDKFKTTPYSSSPNSSQVDDIKEVYNERLEKTRLSIGIKSKSALIHTFISANPEYVHDITKKCLTDYKLNAPPIIIHSITMGVLQSDLCLDDKLELFRYLEKLSILTWVYGPKWAKLYSQNARTKIMLVDTVINEALANSNGGSIDKLTWALNKLKHLSMAVIGGHVTRWDRIFKKMKATKTGFWDSDYVEPRRERNRGFKLGTQEEER